MGRRWAGLTDGAGLMSARTTLSLRQILFLTLVLNVALGTLCLAPALAASVVFIGLMAGFFSLSAWRILVLCSAPRRRPPDATAPFAWPRYTVVAALYHEAEILPQLIERLSRIDYPPDRLQGFLALEADDAATIEVAQTLPRPDWLKVLIVPAGVPQTKPRALNYALNRASGDLLTIYDAEDDPDPQQLREAAARFFADGDDLACLQAPLRIRSSRKSSPSPLLDRQFAAEYAALFEIVMPAMARLGLPFPLGGTSNHFRVPVLRAVGGWDSWNVTEDADLGFRIWRAGYRLGVIHRPTYEPPPGPIQLWLPQRTRWLKGYLQTLAVHSRHLGGMGWRGWSGLIATIGTGLASAAVHAVCTAWLFCVALTSVVAGRLPHLPPLSCFVLVVSLGTAWLVKRLGARRAGAPYGPADMIVSLGYWCLLSLAFAHAAARLVFEPHRWDKTPHLPEPEPDNDDATCPNAGRAAA